MQKFLALGLTLLLLSTPSSAQKGKLGKLFIRSAVADSQFADPQLDDTVKDLKRRSGDFEIVENESDASFLMIVLERKTEMRGRKFGGDPQSYKLVIATLSVRDGEQWKPGAKLMNDGPTKGASWGLAAGNIINRAEKWVKESRE